jgi:hypothetical protein
MVKFYLDFVRLQRAKTRVRYELRNTDEITPFIIRTGSGLHHDFCLCSDPLLHTDMQSYVK